MLLKFLGNGSGFADEHTSAYFVTDELEFVLLDCSMLILQKLKKMNLSNYKRFTVLVTHTHGDHISGLGLFTQYLQFVLKKPITIVAPCQKVLDNLFYLLTELDGCDTTWFTLTSAGNFKAKWFCQSIPTTHSPQLKGKCYGYHLKIEGTDVIYSGDTATIKPFIPFLSPNCEFYVDISVHYGMIHVKLSDVLDDLIKLSQKEVHIYLMHLDDIAEAQKIITDIPHIQLA